MLMSATTSINGDDIATEIVTAKRPKRPRPGGLTYTRQELAYVLGVSMRQLDDLKHQMPKPLAALGRHPRWSRETIQRWVENGCKAPR
jgi:hypothetical protein